MVIYFGADHGGFPLKEHLKTFVKGLGYETADMGNERLDPADDYPDFAAAVAAKISGAEPGQARGILICRNGAGVTIAANKFPGVRAALALNPDHAFDIRNDDDANVLGLAADFVTPEEAERLVRIFLEAPFEPAERRVRRLNKIKEMEKHYG